MPLLKTLTFAVLHFGTAFAVVFAMTGSLALGGAVAVIEPICNTVVFYFHERLWLRFGKRPIERSTGYGHDLLWNRFQSRREQASEQAADSHPER